MKLVKVERAGETGEGLLDGETVHIIGGWRAGRAEDVAFSLSKLEADALAALTPTESVPLASVTLAVPIDPRAKILCVGMNYRDHVGEIKLEVAANPTIFTRFHDSLVPHGAPLTRARISETYDFEGEIAIVISREARHVRVEDAMAHVGGYACFMDGSVREYQKHSLTAGKNAFRSGAMGPWIVPAGALGIDDPQLTTRLNGQIVQQSRASMMIFGIAETIAYVSRWTVLRPGDVIATGTPGGVGSRREPPLWMKAGDRIEVEVEGVGLLSNPVVDEA